LHLGSYSPIPRPERETGHTEICGGVGGGTGMVVDPVNEEVRTRMLALIDREHSAPDTLEGDVLKAHAILTRAVQRLGRAHAAHRLETLTANELALVELFTIALMRVTR